MSYGNFASNFNSPMANLGETVANSRNKMGGLFSSFRNNRVVSGTSEFLANDEEARRLYLGERFTL